MTTKLKVGKWCVDRITFDDYIKNQNIAREYYFKKRATPSETSVERHSEGDKYITKTLNIINDTAKQLGIKINYYGEEYKEFELAFKITAELVEKGRV